MEAFQYELPALTLDHAGARAVMRPEFGAVASPATFLGEMRRLATADLSALGRAAAAFARSNPFAGSAASLATVLAGNRAE